MNIIALRLVSIAAYFYLRLLMNYESILKSSPVLGELARAARLRGWQGIACE